MTHDRRSRAQGCLIGQLAGDALGSLVEFLTADAIRRQYPDGPRLLADGGTNDTIAGQPTDDSEMALMLARMLVARRRYDADAALLGYQYWARSMPFACGRTIAGALRGRRNPKSQANGALMRISPLGIFGAGQPLSLVAELAEKDAALTHVHPLCGQANALFTMAIAEAISSGLRADELYEKIVRWAQDRAVDPRLMNVVGRSAVAPPDDYMRHMGWVLIAFGNALWQLVNAPSFEAGVVDTVQRGGDTDTNAAIAGALLGAVYGLEAVPSQWVDRVLSCRPEAGRPGVRRPRPECFWPVDALELASELLALGESAGGENLPA